MRKYILWSGLIGFVLAVFTGVLTVLGISQTAYFFAVLMLGFFVLAIAAPSLLKLFRVVRWRVMTRGIINQPSLDEVFENKYNLESVDVYLLKRGAWDKLLNEPGVTTSRLREMLTLPGAVADLSDADFEKEIGIIGFVGLFRFGQDSDGLWWRLQDSAEVSQRWVDEKTEENKRSDRIIALKR